MVIDDLSTTYNSFFMVAANEYWTNPANWPPL